MSDPIFWAGMSDRRGNFLELSLPATDYELLDALEQLDLPPTEDPACIIGQYNAYPFLAHAADAYSPLFETNALAKKLAVLDDADRASFEGLVKMECGKQDGPIPLPRLIDLACSTDCCNTAPACSDDELGRFYADNGFVKELEDISDCLYDKVCGLLDFSRIGKNAREEEGGVFTPCGYVVQTSDLNQVSDTLDFLPHKPDYVFRLTLGTPSGSQTAVVELPAEQRTLDQALETLGLYSLNGAVLRGFDGVPLGLDRDLHAMGSLENLNELAKSVAELDSQGRLPVLKSVLHAAACRTVEDARSFSDAIDDYILKPSQRSAPDLARDTLMSSLSESAFQTLLPHVDLFSYGQDLLQASHSAVTPYGIIRHKDGIPIQLPSEQAAQPAMEMG